MCRLHSAKARLPSNTLWDRLDVEMADSKERCMHSLREVAAEVG